MNNREIFEVVEIEVIAFDAEDIIRTSDLSEDNDLAGGFTKDGQWIHP